MEAIPVFCRSWPLCSLRALLKIQFRMIRCSSDLDISMLEASSSACPSLKFSSKSCECTPKKPSNRVSQFCRPLCRRPFIHGRCSSMHASLLESGKFKRQPVREVRPEVAGEPVGGQHWSAGCGTSQTRNRRQPAGRNTAGQKVTMFRRHTTGVGTPRARRSRRE